MEGIIGTYIPAGIVERLSLCWLIEVLEMRVLERAVFSFGGERGIRRGSIWRLHWGGFGPGLAGLRWLAEAEPRGLFIYLFTLNWFMVQDVLVYIFFRMNFSYFKCSRLFIGAQLDQHLLGIALGCSSIHYLYIYSYYYYWKYFHHVQQHKQ